MSISPLPEYNLKTIRSDFRSTGLFYTTPELARFLRSLLPDDVTEIYDPTCGSGALLAVFGDEVKKYGQDVNAEQLQVAREHLTNFTGVCADTLTDPAWPERRFRAIIANPPFSIRWEPRQSPMFEGWPALPPRSKADYAFIAHILHRLSDDGTAAVLCFPGILYRGNAEGKIREYLVGRNVIDSITAVDRGSFVDTSIPTCALALKKRRDTADITFRHKDRSRAVSPAEIAENGYNLSVSRYLPEEQPMERPDPIELEKQVRFRTLSNLRRNLQIERIVCEREKLDIEPFLQRIESLVSACRSNTLDDYPIPEDIL